MKHYEELQNIVRTNSDWLSILKPYLKSFRDITGRPSWIELGYNLMELPTDKDIFNIICECRGSVIDKVTGEMICAPFVKFWNYNEEPAAKIDWSTAKVTHKRDGWIFKAFKNKGFVYFMTASIVITEDCHGAPVEELPGLPKLESISDVLNRALGGKGFFKDGFFTCEDDWCKAMPEGATYCFELESPWNVIHTHLVKDAKLWFIMFRDADGNEMDIYKAKDLFKVPFECPQLYDFNEKNFIEKLKSWNINDNGEGVVVYDKDFNRIKVKCDDYLRVKYLENTVDLNNNRLFKLILSGESDDLVSMCPDLKPKVKLILDKMVTLENGLAYFEKIEEDLKSKSSTKRDFIKALKESKFNKYFQFIVKYYDHSLQVIKDDLYNKWRIKRDGYADMVNLIENVEECQKL